jgi:hypothetical protein
MSKPHLGTAGNPVIGKALSFSEAVQWHCENKRFLLRNPDTWSETAREAFRVLGDSSLPAESQLAHGKPNTQRRSA